MMNIRLFNVRNTWYESLAKLVSSLSALEDWLPSAIHRLVGMRVDVADELTIFLLFRCTRD